MSPYIALKNSGLLWQANEGNILKRHENEKCCYM